MKVRKNVSVLLVIFYIVMLLPAIVMGQQANVNLDYNPQKNTENLIPQCPA